MPALSDVGAEYFTRNVSSIGTLYDRRKVSVAVLDQKSVFGVWSHHRMSSHAPVSPLTSTSIRTSDAIMITSGGVNLHPLDLPSRRAAGSAALW